MEIFKQALALVIAPPGSWAYHFIIIFTLTIAAALALGGPSGEVRRRLLSVSASLLFLRLLVLVFELLPPSILDVQFIFPPLDRAVGTLTILLLIWIFAFPETSPLADGVLTFLSIVTLAGLGVAGWQWWELSSAGRAMDYNGTQAETIWEGIKITLLLLGGGLLLLRRKDNWGIGLIVLALLEGGHLIHYQFVETADVAGAERLAEIVAWPCLTVFIYRRTRLAQAAAENIQAVLFTPSVMAGQPASPPPTKAAGRPLTRRIGVDPKAAVALLAVGAAPTPAERAQQAVRAMAHTFMADICLFIGPPDIGGVGKIVAGYDLINDKQLGETSLPLGELPQVAAAVLWNQPAALMPGAHEPQLRRLSESLQLDEIGPTLIVPIGPTNGTPLGAIALLAPYSQKVWTPGDLNLLTALSRPLAEALSASAGGATAPTESSHLPPNVAETIERLTQELERMTQVAQELEQRQLYAGYTLPDFVEETEETIGQLTQELEQRQAEVYTAEEMARAAQEVLGRLSIDLSEAWAEAARLSKELNELRQAAEEAQAPLLLPLGVKTPARVGESKFRAADLQKIATLVQEMRQPIVSIGNYMDNLLNETGGGTLAAAQRKLAERTKVACERLKVTLDDLVRVAIIEPATVDLAWESVDVVKLIQEAVQTCEMQYRDKNLQLRLDVDAKVPAIQGDRGALLQILVQLLNNARNASEPGSEVALSARHEVQRPEAGEPVSYLFISVRDTGGGIPPEDQPRVFSELYSDSRRIPGLGETGMGLAVAKALVEAHQGRIWITSEMGSGTAFHVLLPAAAKAMAAKSSRGAA